MLQPKDIDWLNGYKDKIRIYAVYKKPTSNLKTHPEKYSGIWPTGALISLSALLQLPFLTSLSQ